MLSNISAGDLLPDRQQADDGGDDDGGDLAHHYRPSSISINVSAS